MFSEYGQREYHNWEHIQGMLDNAENDPQLIIAIFFHDVIYDGKGNHELRSIEYMRSLGFNCPKAEELIKSTITHTPCEDNRLILLDLQDFKDPIKRQENYQKVKLECMRLYNISEEEFRTKNQEYLEGLYSRINGHPDFVEIAAGIREQIDENH